MKKILKNKAFECGFAFLLTAFTAYALLDVFVIPHSYAVAQEASQQEADESSSETDSDTLTKQTAEEGDVTEVEDSSQPDNASPAPGSQKETLSPPNADSDAAASDFSEANPSSTDEMARGPRHGRGKGERQTPPSQNENAPGRQTPVSEESSSDSQSSSGSQSGSGSQSSSGSQSGSGSATGLSAQNTDYNYQNENVAVGITEYRANDTTIYVADVTLTSPEYLKTAFANNTYGRNIKAKTSETASAVDAVLAVNGDFYGARSSGYVIRNGVLYQDTSSGSEDLVIYSDGSFGIIKEGEVSAQALIDQGAMQVFSFGPALIENGEIAVTKDEEVGKAMASNPRTAIGIIGQNHYVLVVSDGRTGESEGLSLNELAQFMQGLGVSCAYNLDGGGSSTMVFNGTVINNPTTGGNSIKERSVSDIVYIGA